MAELERERNQAAAEPEDSARLKQMRQPCVAQYALQLPPRSPADSTADWERLKDALEAVTGRRNWKPNLHVASRLADLFRRTDGKLYAVVTADCVLDVHETEQPVYTAAFDVGTNFIAGYLLRAGGTTTETTAGMQNPQMRYGEDVIQRAKCALKRGTEVLATSIRGAIDHLIGRLCSNAGIERRSVYAISLVGNTCMHHLFLGISPEALLKVPYSPVIREGLMLQAADYGIEAHAEAILLMPPVIAGFLGSDTVGSMLTCHWERQEKLTLLIDIDTNGEIVLGNRHQMVACSVAAGPAFEGDAIGCGMRTVKGAIDRVFLSDDAVQFHVLGERAPKGICGSGLIDLLAILRRLGEIDESGRLRSGSEYVLPGTAISLSQKDIRELQMAKGAICAGIRLLCWKLNVAVEEIERVYIAGTFGSYIYPESACIIGLFPMELRHKITHIGNAAGEGARLVLQDLDAWELAETFSSKTEYLSLPAVPQFRDEFLEGMKFPRL